MQNNYPTNQQTSFPNNGRPALENGKDNQAINGFFNDKNESSQQQNPSNQSNLNNNDLNGLNSGDFNSNLVNQGDIGTKENGIVRETYGNYIPPQSSVSSQPRHLRKYVDNSPDSTAEEQINKFFTGLKPVQQNTSANQNISRQ